MIFISNLIGLVDNKEHSVNFIQINTKVQIGTNRSFERNYEARAGGKVMKIKVFRVKGV